MKSVILDGDPGAVSCSPVTARLDEADDPLAVAAPAFQKLEHAVVVDGFADQGPSNIFGQVVVADAYGVGVTMRSLDCFGSRPRTDAFDALERRANPFMSGVVSDETVDGCGDIRRRHDYPRTRRLHPGRVPRPRRVAAHGEAVGATRNPDGAGPGAGSPYCSTSLRHESRAWRPVVF